MTLKLLTEQHLAFLSLKEAAHARLSSFMSKCHIDGNHISRLNLLLYCAPTPHGAVVWSTVCDFGVVCGFPDHALLLFGPRRTDKTCLRGFRQNEFQNSLLSYRD